MGVRTIDNPDDVRLEPENTSIGGNPQPPAWQGVSESAYIALDGMSREELSDEQAERLERHVAEFVLSDLGVTFSDVRFVRGSSGVIEFEELDASVE